MISQTDKPEILTIEEIDPELADMLGRFINRLNADRKFRRNPLTAFNRECRNMAGRNEPCPCGSGRKFKQCCQKETA